jgi:anti-anti-sigma factor
LSDAELALDLDGDVLVARLHGEIDMANADDLRAQIVGAVPNSALGVVVDLTDVTYLDSSGVRLLFELSDRLGGRQQGLRLVAPEDAQLRRVLGVVDPGGSLPVVTARGDAVEQLNSPQ